MRAFRESLRKDPTRKRMLATGHQPKGRPLPTTPGPSPVVQRPTHRDGDLLARRTDRILLRIATGNPHLAAEGLHGRRVDHPTDDRVVECDELTVLGRIALKHDMRS